MRTRRQGLMETLPEDKPVGLAVEAIKFLKEREQGLAADRARKAAMPVPNRICYAETAFKNWKPGMRIPPCKVCGDLLHPEENHVCSGFKPKFVEHDQDWHDRQDAKREEIREANYNRPKKCLGCHEVIYDGQPSEDDPNAGLDEAMWHEEHCCSEMPRGRHWYTDYDPIVGDNDGHECYEDEPEEDYCEGDDDGYDCD